MAAFTQFYVAVRECRKDKISRQNKKELADKEKQKLLISMTGEERYI